MALASARAGRGANTPAFLLTDEKVLQVVAGLGVSRHSSSRRGVAENAPCSTPADRTTTTAHQPGLNRWFGPLLCGGMTSSAESPVFLTSEKARGVVAGPGISRHSSSRTGCRRERTVQHTSGLNHHHSPPARSESMVRPAPVRGQAARTATRDRGRLSARSCANARPVPLMPSLSSSLPRRTVGWWPGWVLLVARRAVRGAPRPDSMALSCGRAGPVADAAQYCGR